MMKTTSQLLIFLGLTLIGTLPASAQIDVVGSWDAPVQLLVEGVHGAVLPSGKVLYLPHRVTPDGTTESVVFDPNNPDGANYVTAPQNYFCGGHTMLSDGKLLFNGGETLEPNPLRAAGYFDYVTETWYHLGRFI